MQAKEAKNTAVSKDEEENPFELSAEYQIMEKEKEAKREIENIYAAYYNHGKYARHVQDFSKIVDNFSSNIKWYREHLVLLFGLPFLSEELYIERDKGCGDLEPKQQQLGTPPMDS